MKDEEPISEKDLAQIVAFLDGDLNPEEAHGFKLRLLREPTLSRALLEYESTATRVARGLEREPASSAVREGSRRFGGRRPLVILSALLATAATIVLAVVLWPEGEDPGARPGLEMAVLVNAPENGLYHRELGLPPKQERALYRSKAEQPPGYWSEEQYLAQALSVQRQRCETWFEEEARTGGELTAPLREVKAGRFSIPFRLPREATVVAIVALASGEVTLQYPSEDYPAHGDRGGNRFSPGELHYLPQSPLRQVTDDQGNQQLVHDPGFKLSRGFGSARVLLAARRAAADGSFATELAGFQAGLPAPLPDRGGTPERLEQTLTALRTWLEDRGFVVRTILVVEP